MKKVDNNSEIDVNNLNTENTPNLKHRNPISSPFEFLPKSRTTYLIDTRTSMQPEQSKNFSVINMHDEVSNPERDKVLKLNSERLTYALNYCEGENLKFDLSYHWYT